MMKMSKKSTGGSGLVYSTEHGKMCPNCARPMGQCSCGQKKAPTKGDGIVRVLRETKGRKGSGVTLVSGLPLAEPELAALAKQLKQRCGSGGTVKNGVIEVQGDQREVVLAELIRLGFQAKKAGG
jgi:translation initiation factor 1